MAVDFYRSTAERITQLRKDAGLTQRELGEEIGSRQSYIHKLESQESKPTGWRTIRDLARVLDASTDYLLGLSDNRDGGLSESERQLLDLFHQLDETNQRFLLKKAADLLNNVNSDEDRVNAIEQAFDIFDREWGPELANALREIVGFRVEQ